VKAEKPKSKQKQKNQLNMKKLFTILGLAGLFLMANMTSSVAQEQPFRIGLKIGVPQIVGLNLEYVTPLMSKKLSADLDLSYFSLSSGAATVSFTVVNIGADYYFTKEGKGLYGGLAFGIMSFTAKEDVTTDAGIESAKGTLGINTLNLKIGGKHGGLFYFRWELGYRIALNTATLTETAPGYSNTVSLPVSGGGILADIGFGLAF
jgi:hypothetical protein